MISPFSANTQNSPLYQTWSVLSQSMNVQSLAARLAAQNFVNVESVGKTPEDKPYGRKQIIIQARRDPVTGVTHPVVKAVDDDPAPPKMVYKPGHPAANKKGQVKYPNINPALELVDFQQATITSKACADMYKTASAMIDRSHNLMRST